MQPIRIDHLFEPGKPTISFEFFPPKNDAGWAQLYSAIGELHSLKPSYVSPTGPAGARGKKPSPWSSGSSRN
jgi:methylenetetrahydrofolate reductase (NADPH)